MQNELLENYSKFMFALCTIDSRPKL